MCSVGLDLKVNDVDQVLNGIQYIHRDLKILHGSIAAANIMVTRAGCIKIGPTSFNLTDSMLRSSAANVGQSMLEAVSSVGNEQKDIRALGLLMIRLMELGTSLESPDLLELKKPETWNDDIKDFLSRTIKYPGDTLKDVRYLPFAILN